MNGFEIQVVPGAGLPTPFDPQASGTAFPEEWFFEALTWGRSDSGETVNPRTALAHGPVWQAVNILAGDVGQLPLNIYRRTNAKDPRVVEIDAYHPVDWLLAHEPNPWQTPAVWKETMMAWALLWGNGCSWIIRDNGGRPTMLLPLMPDRTHPLEVDGEYWNWIETDLGDGKRFPIPYEDVFHLRGLADDGFWGLSAVNVCKNVIGGGIAAVKHKNRTFRNGATLGGALENPGAAPTPEKMREMREQLEAVHGGSHNAGKWLFLYGGTKFSPYAMSNVDAQTLQLLDLDREQIASIFMLPPYKLGAMKNSAVRANLEQQNSDYLYTSLSRHLNKAKEEVERKLFNSGERRLQRVYAAWDVDVLLKADLAARGTYYSQAKTGEWMTTNEIRFEEGLPPLPGGDELRNPAINPATPAEPKPAKTEQAPANEPAKQSARALVKSRVEALLDKEASTADRACREAGNLVRWAENYYEAYQRLAEDYLSLSCELAGHSGLTGLDWRRATCDHARDSLNRLLSMAGIATKASLPQIGRDFADSVRERKELLAKAVLGG